MPPRPTPDQAYDAVVVGAGISGAAAAYELAAAGCSVVLLDRFGPAAMASGWTLAGVRQSGRHAAELPLAKAAVQRWGTLADELDAPTGYRRTGNLRCARTPAEVAIIRDLVTAQAAAGLELSFLADTRSVQAAVPAVSDRVLAASFCASDGSADPHATVAAYVAAAERLGAVCRFGERVLRVEHGQGRVSAVVTAAGRIPTARVVIAAGMFANDLLEPLGICVPLQTPMVAVLRSAPLPPLLGPVIGVANADCAGRQEGNGRLRVTSGALPWHGGLLELEQAGRPTPHVYPTAGHLADIVRHFGDVVPAFRDAQIEQSWAGLLDMTPDALPVIDAVPGVAGAFVAAGFSGHGFCLGPLTGSILATLAQDGQPDANLEPFAITRFQTRRRPEPVTLHG